MKEPLNKPRFLFAGTAKAGTTSIYEYLKQHPEIEIPIKETFYFMRDVLSKNTLPYPRQRPLKELILNPSEYWKNYENISADKVVGEIGTGYLYYSQMSIPRIKEMLGNEVRICIILRNPVERCYSSYMHFVKDLHERGTFQESLIAEESRIQKNWDFMWHHKSVGKYAQQVEAYMSAFPHVRVWLYDDLVNNPTQIMTEIVNFIGASPKTDWKVEKHFNPSGQAKNASLQKFITHENPLKFIIRPIFRLLFSKEKREQIRKNAKNSNLVRAEKLTSSDRAELKLFYENDIQKLSKLINRDLSHWLSP